MKKFSILMLMLTCITGLFAQPCSKLFISEYVEGSSNNKALEIYNPTSAPINLSGYRLVQYNNGGDTVRYTIGLTGTINAYDVYVIVNSQGNATIKANADSITTNGLMGFNGDDVIALLSPANDTLDRIGVIGVATKIAIGDTLAENHTFVRLASVQEGTKDWAIGTTQWTKFPQDVFSYLGSHTNSCASFTDTLVTFSQASASVNEEAGTFNVNLQINAPSAASTFGVNVELVGGTGTAADIDNYTTQTVTFLPTVGLQTVTLTITDDALVEGAETLIFKLRNATGGVMIGADSIFTLTINASDAVAAPYTIAQITGIDTAGRPDSLGVAVKITGTVIGINLRAAGLEFFIHDGTDGIGVFSPSSTFGYTVAEGDSVHVEGDVAFYNGLTQLQFLDTVYKIGTGVVPTAVVVQDLGEDTEAELVRLNNVHLVDASQWVFTNPAGFNTNITDGNGTWALRIDEQTNIFTSQMAVPTGNFDVIGIGSQFDNTSPYTSSYQILPRSTTDIILHNGVQEVDNNFARIYPNPNSGNFTVVLAEQGVETEVRVLSLTGAVVFSTKGTDMIKVNTVDLSSGLYIVEAANANKISRSKIQVQ